ncbi:MAG TPA: efflux RND transporter periplasmic adaptor subunit [Bryobacteraceae bacterium]|nr:efflux RND transporter periplasmic adaptor subunit [Bryobacteraceae bacterium]
MSSIDQPPVIRVEVPGQANRPRRTTVWVAAVLAAVALLGAGIIPRMQRSARAAETAETASSSLANVLVVKARLTSGSADLELPGNIQALNVASIYARTSGYVQQRLVDIGTPVKAGQLLAVIASPEVDQELAQGRAAVEQARAALEQANANLAQARAQVNQANANVAQAQANEELAATTNDRWTRLVDRGVLPKQQGDERRSAFDARHAETNAAIAAETTAEANVGSRTADVSAARAAIDAQLANVRRLEQMQSFERVLAPFDGVVTERRIEKGDLISAGSGTDRNLFTVAQSTTLRIQVSVPQNYAVDLQPGQDAEVTLRERPGETFHGKIARTAESIAAATRTLLTEVQVDNSSGRLLSGMYAEVKFTLQRSHPVVLIPGSALVANAQGTRVAEVGLDRRVHLITVQTGRDLGTEIEILLGLSGSEQVINNPPDNLSDAQQVNVIASGRQ